MTMKANIDAISYITDDTGYHIVTEFSMIPIETFKTEQGAIEFIEGYHGENDITEAHKKGEMFKAFVRIDLTCFGVEYNKVREVFNSDSELMLESV